MPVVPAEQSVFHLPADNENNEDQTLLRHQSGQRRRSLLTWADYFRRVRFPDDDDEPFFPKRRPTEENATNETNASSESTEVEQDQGSVGSESESDAEGEEMEDSEKTEASRIYARIRDVVREQTG